MSDTVVFSTKANIPLKLVYNILSENQYVFNKYLLCNTFNRQLILDAVIKDIHQNVNRGNIYKYYSIQDNELLRFLILIKKSLWDTNHFNISIAKSIYLLFKRDTDINSRRTAFLSLKEYLKKENIQLFILRVPLQDTKTHYVVEQEEANLTDVLITLVLHTSEYIKMRSKYYNLKDRYIIEPANKDDIPELMMLAANIFEFDHFHNDPRIPQEKSDQMFSEWIKNSIIEKLADIVFVAREGKKIAGFITCKIKYINSKYTYGIIDLIGVSKEYRQKGIGINLMDNAISWFINNNVPCIYIGTQASNIPALRLYEKLGFRIVSAEGTYHLWLQD